MADFVFIHGGLHGAWCWNPLISELEKRGHRGFAFDLPGHGNDPTPRFTVTFDAYTAAANRFLQSRDFDSLILVGHSIAGMLLPEVIRDNAGTIAEVVFLAALVLDQGEAAIDLIPESRRSSYFDMADQIPRQDHQRRLRRCLCPLLYRSVRGGGPPVFRAAHSAAPSHLISSRRGCRHGISQPVGGIFSVPVTGHFPGTSACCSRQSSAGIFRKSMRIMT